MKVSEVKSKFFKIEAYFASNAFESFKNTPKRFQISFLGHRSAKFIILKSKVEKKIFGQKSSWEAGFYCYFCVENSTVHDLHCEANSGGLFRLLQGSSMCFLMILGIYEKVLETCGTAPNLAALVKWPP